MKHLLQLLRSCLPGWLSSCVSALSAAESFCLIKLLVQQLSLWPWQVLLLLCLIAVLLSRPLLLLLLLLVLLPVPLPLRLLLVLLAPPCSSQPPPALLL